MIGEFRYDHLRQQTRSGRALLDRLRGLVRRLYGAIAGVLQAHILDHFQLGRNVFVAFAGLFRDEMEIFAATVTVLVCLRQIVHDPFPDQILCQRLPPGSLLYGCFGRLALRRHLPVAGPSRVLQTASVALSRVVRSCGCAALPAVRAAGSGTCPFPRFRAGVARTGPPRSSVTHRHRSAVCWDRWAAPVCRITATPLPFKQNQTRIKMFYALVRRYRLRRVALPRSMPLSSAPSSSTLISKRREPGSPQGIA